MDKVTLIGEKADGSREVIGEVPMPVKMKARQIARSYFGESSGEGDEADMCLGALEELHDWMLKQGWQPPPMTLTPNVRHERPACGPLDGWVGRLGCD